MTKNEYAKQYYAKNRDRIIANRKKRHNVFMLIAQLKTSCYLCKTKDKSLLNFHHKNSKLKIFWISQSDGHSIKTLFSEVSKCVVLCRSCHRKVHILNRVNTNEPKKGER